MEEICVPNKVERLNDLLFIKTYKSNKLKIVWWSPIKLPTEVNVPLPQ